MMLLDIPAIPGAAVRAVTVGVAVSCWNAAHAAFDKEAQTQFNRWHRNGGLAEGLEKWVGQTWQRAQETADVLHEAYEVLANSYPTTPQLDQFYNAVYPVPFHPTKGRYPGEAALEKATRTWEALRDRQNASMSRAKYLFLDGMGQGMEHVARRDTWWGAYMGVSAERTYALNRNFAQTGWDVNFGNRARTIQAAFTNAMKAAKTGELSRPAYPASLEMGKERIGTTR